MIPPVPAGESPEAPAPVPTPSLWQPGASVPLTPEAKEKWDAELDRAERKAKTFHPQWTRGLNRYAKALTPARKKRTVNALKDYAHVEGKKSQLFHRTPEVSLLPVDPTDPQMPIAAVLPARQKVLNHELGPKGANAKRALHKTLMETLAASGFMAVKIGYEQVALPVPDPLTGQPQIGPDGTEVQVPIWSRRFFSAIESWNLLIPARFSDSSHYDAAPWLGVKDRMPVAQARKLGWAIPPEFQGQATRPPDDDGEGQLSEDTGDEELTYREVWYRAHLYDETVFHPELIRCLILVDGVDEPAWHVNSPYQSLTPQGQLTDDSMVGFPIHVGTLRDMPKSAYVPSDLVIGEQLSEELNEFRTDLIANRKGRRSVTLVSDQAGDTIIDKIAKNEGPVPVPGEFIDAGGQQRLMAIVQAGTEPRDNFSAQDYIERDRELALGASPNQSGQFAQQKRTATEVRTVAGSSSARAQTEQDRIREYFVAAVRKFDCLVQRTMTVLDVQKILGPQGAALWEQWKLLPGTYLYDIQPDAGRYLDPQQHRMETVDLYNMTRKDDRVNPEELLVMLARAFNRDPAKFIAPPSGKTMEPPKATISFDVEKLHDPVGGQLFLALLKAGGVQVSPDLEALFKAANIMAAVAGTVGGMNPDGTAAGGAEHGGSADTTEPINKHQRQKTGGVQGVGVQ